jgi:MORN repeat
MFENGQRCGYGRFDFVEDKIDRLGKTMGYYKGEWKDGLYYGTGTIVYDSTGLSYTGAWCNGLMHGYGTEIHSRSGQTLRQGQWIRGDFLSLHSSDTLFDTAGPTTATTVVSSSSVSQQHSPPPPRRQVMNSKETATTVPAPAPAVTVTDEVSLATLLQVTCTAHDDDDDAVENSSLSTMTNLPSPGVPMDGGGDGGAVELD